MYVLRCLPLHKYFNEYKIRRNTKIYYKGLESDVINAGGVGGGAGCGVRVAVCRNIKYIKFDRRRTVTRPPTISSGDYMDTETYQFCLVCLL